MGPRVIIRSHEPPSRGAGGPDPRVPRRVVLVWVVIGLVAAAGVTWAVLRFTRGDSAAAPTATTPSPNVTSIPAAPIATATAGPTTSSSGGAGTGTAYVLTTPATAGGYTLTTPMSASIKEIGTEGATALMQGGAAAGGSKGTEITAEYFISGNQALSYTGYTGTFTPQTVINAFGMMATGVASEPAGSHGGLLSCGTMTVTSPAASTGTACVWATPTTVGLVQFFGGDALERVTMTRAGQDTAKFRADVETLKGATPTGTN